RLAEKIGMQDRLTIVPFIEEHELPALFHLADVHVMVSRWDETSRQVDGFGIVYLEAAASGRPSIAGSAGGAPEAVMHGVSGLVVDATSPSQTGHAITRLLRNTELAASFGEAGRSRVRNQFT